MELKQVTSLVYNPHRVSVQEYKKDRRFFVQLIKNLFVQSIEIVIQLVKGKLSISQGFNEQSANKLFVVGEVFRI